MVEILVAVVGIAVLVTVAVTLWRQPHPEDASDHHEERDATEPGSTAHRYPSGSRPAGPGAESQDPESRPEELPEP